MDPLIHQTKIKRVCLCLKDNKNHAQGKTLIKILRFTVMRFFESRNVIQ